MANRLIDNPLVIDTTSASVLLTGRRKIQQIEYTDYANDTDTAEVQNEDGRVIYKANGSADLETVRSGRIGWVKGIKVPAANIAGGLNMPNGKVLIYFE